jgi:hypothetical protein
MSANYVRRTGAFTGTGAEITLIGAKVGFRPSYVRIANETGPVLEWFDSMDPGTALKRNEAGASTFLTTEGVTPLDQGFSLGAAADVNVADEQLYFFALG